MYLFLISFVRFLVYFFGVDFSFSLFAFLLACLSVLFTWLTPPLLGWVLLKVYPHESWHCHLVIFPVSLGKRKIHWCKNLLIQYIQVVSWPHFLAHNVTEPRPEQLKQPQIITLPPQACTVGARHDGSITSSSSLLPLTPPSLWNRVTGFLARQSIYK